MENAEEAAGAPPAAEEPAAGEGVAAGAEAVAEEDDGDPDKIPASWGWPRAPFDAMVLKHWVLEMTKDSSQERWEEAMAARSVGGTYDDFVAEKAFANLLLNKEGTGEEKEGKAYEGVDPNAYRKGKWYKFLNHKGDCYVYVHNYTRDITATMPENFGDMSEEEKHRMKKLGVFIKELPQELEKIYDKVQRIPIVHCSLETSLALKKLAEYGGGGAGNWSLLDCSKMKRINAKLLEEARQAIVTAMRYGKWLMVYLSNDIPEFAEKICISKNRDSFPIGVWQYGGLEPDMVKDRIYRPDDKDGNQCVVQKGFRVCVVLPFDSMNFDMTSYMKDDLPNKIPYHHHMEEVRCYSEEDVTRFLSRTEY